jgi:hypothetical protein
MSIAVTRVVGHAKHLDLTTPYGFDGGDICVVGAFIHTGRSVTITRSFERGVRYLVLGGGADNAADVDVAISDGRGRQLAKDIDRDPAPLLTFAPPATGQYTVNLLLPETTIGTGAFVAAAIMRQGGYTIPVDRFVASFSRALTVATAAAQRQPFVFHEGAPGRAEPSFYSTVIGPGGYVMYSGVHPTSPLTVALSGADDAAGDLDIHVVDVATNTIVARDTDDDATPVTSFRGRPERVYGAVVSNEQSHGATLVTTLILEASD